MTEITEQTKLSELLQAYPWLIDEAVKIDKGFRILKSPVGRLFLKNASIGELSQKAGLSSGEIIETIEDMIRLRESDNRQ